MVWKIQHRAVGREGLERGGKGLWTYRHVSSRWGAYYLAGCSLKIASARGDSAGPL